MRQQVAKHPIASFVVLSYGITWLWWIPAILMARRRGFPLPYADNYAALLETGIQGQVHAASATIFFMAVYGPLFAALVLTTLGEGGPGLATLLRRMLKIWVDGRWYLWLLAISLLFFGFPVLVGSAAGLLPESPIQVVAPGFFLGMLAMQILTSGLGEEPGWRGYLQPRLQAAYPGSQAIWRLGLIWAAWHYPFTIFYTLEAMPSDIELPAAAVAITVLLSLVGQTLSLIGLSFIYAWFVNHTGSVFLAIIFHGLNNALPFLIIGGLGSSMGLLAAVLPWVVVFLMERWKGEDWYLARSAIPASGG